MRPGPRAAACVALALAASLPPAREVAFAAAPLEPYRELARSAEAPRLLALAREAMERHWPGAAAAGVDSAAGAAARPIPWPGAPVALYLSLLDGRATRACVGRAPGAGTLSEAVTALAAEALDADPRRPPLRRGELPRLRIVLAFAGEGEAIADPMLADPAREGLSISSARGTVAFLPGEARTVAWALREARRLGVLDPAAGSATYRRFPAVVIAEGAPPRPAGGEDDGTP